MPWTCDAHKQYFDQNTYSLANLALFVPLLQNWMLKEVPGVSYRNYSGYVRGISDLLPGLLFSIERQAGLPIWEM